MSFVVLVRTAWKALLRNVSRSLSPCWASSSASER